MAVTKSRGFNKKMEEIGLDIKWRSKFMEKHVPPELIDQLTGPQIALVTAAIFYGIYGKGVNLVEPN